MTKKDTQNGSSESSNFSWDTARESAPKRPDFISSVDEEPIISRPKIVWVAFSFIAISTLLFWVVTAIAALNFEDLQKTLVDVMPDDLKEDYEEEDATKAATVLLVSVAGAGVFLNLIILFAGASLAFRRNLAARPVILITSLLYLPAAFVAFTIRDGGTQDLILSMVSALFLFLALVLIYMSVTSKWLRQKEKHRKKQLIERDE